MANPKTKPKPRRITRRQVLKGMAVGATALVVANPLGLLLDPLLYAQVPVTSLDFTITDAIKEMVTHQNPALNPKANIALQYYWIYKQKDLLPESPGPIIFAKEGDVIDIRVMNALDEDHELAIPGIGFTTGRIAPGATFTGAILVPEVSAGTYLYFDSLNPPVNRMMGLHGAFIVMPNPPTGTPYNAADPAGAHANVVQLFADLGEAPWFPGLRWDEAAENPPPYPPTPAFRQYIWVLHEASPPLFADVGDFQAGRDFPAAQFQERFLNNAFVPDGKNKPPAIRGDTPQYFTTSGQSGHFAHANPFVSLHVRVGEPAIARILNPGLWEHCPHLHANHFYVLKLRNEQSGIAEFNPFPELDPAEVPGIEDNLIFIDTFSAHPMDVYDIAIPVERPPDVPNTLGTGRADLSDPLPVKRQEISKFGIRFKNGREVDGPLPLGETTWPPIQEVNMHIPRIGVKLGEVPVHVPLSPLCFPMHDHTEPSQSAQGGNYNQGMMAGINFIGDRNEDRRIPPPRQPKRETHIDFAGDGVITFPHAPLTWMDEAFGDAAANERAVYGADPEQLALPPAGPRPPFEEEKPKPEFEKPALD